MAIWTAAAAIAASLISAPGPQGPLQGTLVDAGAEAPVVLIIPGSGPTDRDGNNPLGVAAAPYRHLAEALAEQGVSSVRIDKRGMFASKAAAADPNTVTIADYVADTHSWVRSIRQRTGESCVWLLGHSEGALVALAAAQTPEGICGLLLVAAPGRPLGVILREQIRANPANAPLLRSAFAAIAELEAGRRIDASKMNPALLSLFAPQVQGFLIDAMAKDPAKLAAATSLPLLIVHGGRDIQVGEPDADALATARPSARRVDIADMNHVLKRVASPGQAANLAAYADPRLPAHPGLVEAVRDFVKR